MNNPTKCKFEQMTIRSVKSGFLNDELRTHLKTCAECGETARITGFFQQISAVDTSPAKLPVAGLIWWKAKLREKKLINERITQPLKFAQIIAIVIAVLTVAAIWIYDPLYFSPLLGILNQTAKTIEQTAIYLFPGVILLMIALAVVFFTLRRPLTE